MYNKKSLQKYFDPSKTFTTLAERNLNPIISNNVLICKRIRQRNFKYPFIENKRAFSLT